MASEVWYRKWRPQTFAEVTGQEHVTRTLANAVAQGRVAHAYLLCGPRGTGKTTTARVLAKAVNCERPNAGEPCTTCESCRAVAEGRALDLVEMDAASNRGIDDIRALRDRVGYHPSGGRYRVYLIDEVHELTAAAFDALLKTLEEPPSHIIFVLATTDAHRVPATIVSRCQRFDLTRIKLADIVARLRFIATREGVAVEDGALDVIARAATGALRDAVNLLEQLVASYGTTLTEAQARAGLGLIADARAHELALLAVRGELAAGLALIASVQEDGVDLRQFNREVVARLRALLLAQAGAVAGLDGYTTEQTAELQRAAEHIEPRRIIRALKAFAAVDLRGEAQPSLPLELALADVALGVEAGAAASPEQPVRAATAVVHALQGVRLPAAAPAAPRPADAAPSPVDPNATGVHDAGGRGRPPVSLEREARAPERPAEDTVAVEASAPVPATTDAPSASGRVITLEEARARYRAIYDALRAENVLVGGLLNGHDVVALDERTITFGFRHAWGPDRLLPGTQNHKLLVSAVERVLGRRFEVRCVHMPDVVDRLKATPARRSHLLDEAQKLGATPIEGAHARARPSADGG